MSVTLLWLVSSSQELVLIVFFLPCSLCHVSLSPQVSQLVIAHEEAAEGGIAHDLTVPVTAVDAAVQNLVVVSGVGLNGWRNLVGVVLVGVVLVGVAK